MEANKSDRHVFSRDHLDYLFDSVRGKSLGEIDSAHVFNITQNNKKVTGIAGDVIEQSVLGYPADSKQEPDLIVDGEEVELKTTGLRYSKKDKGLEGKEPMSITGVSLKTIAGETFYTSNFWHKLKRMLIVYYLYDSDRTVPAGEYARFEIKGHQFHSFSADEEQTLRNDWQMVHDYVERVQREAGTEEELKCGYARLSSALRPDLMMIDTAPKYPNPPRFRLKRSVVTYMARKVFKDGMEMLPCSVSSFRELDMKLGEVAVEYRGKRIGEVAEKLGVRGRMSAKSTSERILVAMLGGTGKAHNIDLFVKTGIKIKSLVITNTGKRTEDMKLCGIDFNDLASCKEYDASALRDYLTSPCIIAVFQEPRPKAPFVDNVFLGFKRFAFPDELVDGDAKAVWSECRRLVVEGALRETPVYRAGTCEPIINKAGTIKTQLNFPKSRDHILFVRGTSSDSTNKPECVNGIRMYRQQFWIKGSYMVEKLQEIDWI